MEKLYLSKTCLKMADGGRDESSTSPLWIRPCKHLFKKNYITEFYLKNFVNEVAEVNYKDFLSKM